MVAASARPASPKNINDGEGAEMNDSMITVTLVREDWIAIGVHLTATAGEIVNFVPTVRLMDSLFKSGISLAEVNPRGGR